MKKSLKILVVLAIFSQAHSLNFGLGSMRLPLLGARRNWQEALTRSSAEPEIVEVVRWRQPVCVVPGKDVQPCLTSLRKFQNDYESNSDKGSEEINSKTVAKKRPEVLSPHIVDEFNVENVDSVNLDGSEDDSGRSFDGSVTLNLRSSTPEIEKTSGSRQGKYLVMSSFGKASTIVHDTPPAIYVTKVLNSPVTATLVANNCFPDIGVPLCDSYQETITIYKDPATTNFAEKQSNVDNTDETTEEGADEVVEAPTTTEGSVEENNETMDFWDDPTNPNFDDGSAQNDPQRPPGLLIQAIQHVVNKPGVLNAIPPELINALANNPAILQAIANAGNTGNGVTTITATEIKPQIVENTENSDTIEVLAATPRPGLIGALLNIQRPAILNNVFNNGFNIFNRSTTSRPAASGSGGPIAGGLLGQRPVIQSIQNFIHRPSTFNTNQKPEFKPVLVVEPTVRPGIFGGLWNPPNFGIFNRVSTSTARTTTSTTMSPTTSPATIPTTSSTTTSTTTSKPNDPPADDPPTDNSATDKPPATDPPADNPPATDPPADNPPATDPPADNPPATDPPADDPPADNPPADEMMEPTNEKTKSIRQPLVEVPERPELSEILFKPENDISGRPALPNIFNGAIAGNANNEAKPTQAPGIFGGLFKNPTKPNEIDESVENTKTILGMGSSLFARPTNKPLIIERPGAKPLLVEKPIYVQEKPVESAGLLNFFIPPSNKPLLTVDHEVIKEPVYVYQKPQTTAGILGNVFGTGPSFFQGWALFGGNGEQQATQTKKFSQTGQNLRSPVAPQGSSTIGEIGESAVPENTESVAAEATPLETSDTPLENEDNESVIDDETIEDIVEAIEEGEIDITSTGDVGATEGESNAISTILVPEEAAVPVKNSVATAPIDSPAASAIPLNEIPENIASEVNAELNEPIDIAESTPLKTIVNEPAIESSEASESSVAENPDVESAEPSESSVAGNPVVESSEASETSVAEDPVVEAEVAIAVKEIVPETNFAPQSENIINEADNSKEDSAIDNIA